MAIVKVMKSSKLQGLHMAAAWLPNSNCMATIWTLLVVFVANAYISMYIVQLTTRWHMDAVAMDTCLFVAVVFTS